MPYRAYVEVFDVDQRTYWKPLGAVRPTRGGAEKDRQEYLEVCCRPGNEHAPHRTKLIFSEVNWMARKA